MAETRMMTDDDYGELMAQSDIARWFGVGKSTVAMWVSRMRSGVVDDPFPPAAIRPGGRPLWRRADVAAWGVRTNRLARVSGHLYDDHGYDVTDQYRPKKGA